MDKELRQQPSMDQIVNGRSVNREFFLAFIRNDLTICRLLNFLSALSTGEIRVPSINEKTRMNNIMDDQKGSTSCQEECKVELEWICFARLQRQPSLNPSSNARWLV